MVQQKLRQVAAYAFLTSQRESSSAVCMQGLAPGVLLAERMLHSQDGCFRLWPPQNRSPGRVRRGPPPTENRQRAEQSSTGPSAGWSLPRLISQGVGVKARDIPCPGTACLFMPAAEQLEDGAQRPRAEGRRRRLRLLVPPCALCTRTGGRPSHCKRSGLPPERCLGVATHRFCHY